MWSFESNQNKADSSYTQDELRPHTDGTYSNDAPGLQLLLCTEYSARGGESILVDGFKIAEKIKKKIVQYLEKSYSPQPTRYAVRTKALSTKI